MYYTICNFMINDMKYYAYLGIVRHLIIDAYYF